jgi:DNA-binding NarL/FixJ family response regulator
VLMIVENNALHREFAARVVSELWNDPQEILEVENGRAAFDIANSGRVNRAILDLQLPECNGIEIARELWRVVPEAQIVFWSNYADEAYVRNLSRIVPASARYGYVLKSAPQATMRAALESVFLKDRRAIDQEIRHVQKRITNRLAGLSDAEYEGLVDIALGLTDQVIAYRRGLTVRGVQNRLRHVYEKLDVVSLDPEIGELARYNSRTRAITYALERGLINSAVLREEEEKLTKWLAEKSASPTALA